MLARAASSAAKSTARVYESIQKRRCAATRAACADVSWARFPDVSQLAALASGAAVEGLAASSIVSASMTSVTGERTLMDEMMEVAVRANKAKVEAKQKESAAAAASFGTGLTGGFFGGSSHNAKSTTSAAAAPAAATAVPTTAAVVATPTPAAVAKPTRQCAYCGSSSGTATFLRCGRCKVVWYCSAECQKRHWSAAHRGECGSSTVCYCSKLEVAARGSVGCVRWHCIVCIFAGPVVSVCL